MLVTHLRYAVNKELQHLYIEVVDVLRASELQLLVFVCRFKVVLKETKVSHNLEVSDCLVVLGRTQYKLHKHLQTTLKLL